MAEQECPDCNGAGFIEVEDVRAVCCGRPNPSGECRGHCAIPDFTLRRQRCPSMCPLRPPERNRS